jgi:hypothetical protein
MKTKIKNSDEDERYNYTSEHFPFYCNWSDLINTDKLNGNEKMYAHSYNALKLEYDTFKEAMKKDELIKKINTLVETNNVLNKQVKEYDKIVKGDAEGLYKFRLGLAEKINPEALESLFKVEPTFSGKDVKGSDSTPIWFYLAIKYYKNRDLVYNMFKLFGFDVPEWMTQFKLPHEWTSEQLICYCDTIHNHYMTNGKTFDADNIQYWYREQVAGWGTRSGNRILKPMEQMKHCYSDIPWQFTLKNPKWVTNKTVFEKLLTTMAADESNANYFLEIDQYCPVKMTKEQLRQFSTAVIKSKRSQDERVAHFIERNMMNLEIDNTSPIFKFIMNSKINKEPSPHASVEVHEYYVNSLKEFEQAVGYVEHCKPFNMIKRAEIIRKLVEKFYGDHKIALNGLKELPK